MEINIKDLGHELTPDKEALGISNLNPIVKSTAYVLVHDEYKDDDKTESNEQNTESTD